MIFGMPELVGHAPIYVALIAVATRERAIVALRSARQPMGDEADAVLDST
jgi:hypothetical protein